MTIPINNPTDNSPVGIAIETRYIAEASLPAEDRFVFAYPLTIHNDSKVTAKLLTRHKVITDGDNTVQQVHGEGVVGEQPYIGPGDAMQGSDQMVIDGDRHFDAPIPPFTLTQSHSLH
ncbi:MAG: ApaG domain [Gammaproteobacteria bacterium]|nr:ApaG domain [Gammaproteobacteria bacterium]